MLHLCGRFEFQVLLLPVSFLGCRFFRIQVHNHDRLPVSRGATPALGVPLPGCFVELDPFAEQHSVQARVALCRCHEADGAVTVFFVIPMNERADPLPCGQKVQTGAADSSADTSSF